MSDTHQFSEDELIELSFLRDLEVDQLINEGLLGDHLQLSSPLDTELAFGYDELTLRVLAGPHYPAVAVTWSIECRHTLSRTAIIDLRARLSEIVDEASRTNNIGKWRERESDAGSGIYEPTMVVLSLAKETVTHIESSRRKVEERNPLKQRHQGKSRSTIQPQLKQVANISQRHSEGIERGTAFELLRKTPADIILKIPSQFRVLHVEEVLRQDLLHAFQKRQERLRHELSGRSATYLRRYVPHSVARGSRIEDMVEHIVKPHQTWHGTQRQFVPSIVRYGFFKPGQVNPATKAEHEVRCGSTYGRGIYSSPDPAFSLSYSNGRCEATSPDQYFGLKLIVCATLMGRASSIVREDNWREEDRTHSEHVDSYVGNRELEYIVFDRAQIIPVYVVHLDWGERNAAHFANLPANPNQWVKAPKPNKTHKRLLKDQQKDIWPDEARRAKQAIMARASKWFPYGYGPATNGKFVVEEVGEVDDDEEEYGDYQALRGEGDSDDAKEGQQANMDFWSWVKAAGVEEEAEFEETYRRKGGPEDEYWKERHSTAKGSQAAFAPSWDSIPDPVVLGDESSDDAGKDEEENEEKEEGYGLARLLI
ncbi:hypothetical protein PG993_004932 [Apiospora rasikravindrae]|uniref:PARP catalytic domain-containing protein n=1 Tax=Apiospora rasikravindrae TaxID=990691 RepID=A0ABR1TE52_9PEZI